MLVHFIIKKVVVLSIHMDIRTKATDYVITPEVSAYLDERLAAIEKMLGDESAAARCEVEIGRAAGNQRHGDHSWFAEFIISVPGRDRIIARNNEATVNAAIDNAKDEALAQLRTEKQTSRRMLRKTGAAIKRLMRFDSGE